MGFRYTSEQLAFLRDGYKAMRIPELTVAFNERFGLDKTERGIKSALNNHSITCGRPVGCAVGERRTYTDEQLAFLSEHYPKMAKPEMVKAFNAKFGESKTVAQIKVTLANYKIHSGRTGCFEKGQKPWNSGTKGVCKPNSGSFQKGAVPGNIKLLGHERICSKDGYVLVKISERNPYTGAVTRYRGKHLAVWEAANGPVPEGHVLRFLDGDKLNCALSNLELISKVENLHLNQLGYSDAPKQLKPTIKALAQLRVVTFARAREVRG